MLLPSVVSSCVCSVALLQCLFSSITWCLWSTYKFSVSDMDSYIFKKLFIVLFVYVKKRYWKGIYKTSKKIHTKDRQVESTVLSFCGFVFGDRVSQCSSGWPRIHNVSQVGLGLIVTFLPEPLCWDYRHEPAHPVNHHNLLHRVPKEGQQLLLL